MTTRQDTVDSPTDPTVAARRSAALVAAVTAFVVPLWFIATLAVVGSYKDSWGHWVIAVVAAVMGVVGALNMVLGGGGSMIVGLIPFGILVGVVLLIARSRLHEPQTMQPGQSPRTG